jgi:glycosyltransferase involved in cell wall biosynthesis
VDAFIVNSTEIRDELLRSAPWIPAEDVHVVLNGVRIPSPPPPGFADRFRAELGIGPGTPLVAGVGHVYPRKGFDLLIDALARLPAAGAHLVIVGEGPHRGQLEERARDLGLGGRVHWTGFRDDVADVLAACDAFALSSRNEGMANVMLEAMAAGTPVVATDISGVRNVLGERDGSPAAGWVVPVDDAAATAAALARVLSPEPADRELVARRRREARRRVEREHSIAGMIDHAARVLSGQARES